jgi:hypothetical protein
MLCLLPEWLTDWFYTRTAAAAAAAAAADDDDVLTLRLLTGAGWDGGAGQVGVQLQPCLVREPSTGAASC